MHYLCNQHVANKKNVECMQPIRKVKELSGKRGMNTDHEFIPNPKSLKPLKGGQNPISIYECEKCMGEL